MRAIVPALAALAACASGAGESAPDNRSSVVTSAVPVRTAPPAEAAEGANRLVERVMGTPDLHQAVELMRAHFRDAPASTDGFAAMEYRDPGETLLRQWSEKHLTWEKLDRPAILDVEGQLGTPVSLRGLVGCVRGELRLRAAQDGAREFVLRDEKRRVSGGWIVGGFLRADSPEPAVICGILVGTHGTHGLRLVGLLEGAISGDRGKSLGHRAPIQPDDRDAGAPPWL